mgnify:CR=1 FL=1
MLSEGCPNFILLRQDHFLFVQDPLEHTKVTPIMEEVTNGIREVRCFALDPGPQGCLPDWLL